MGLLVLFIAGMLTLGGLCVIAGAVWHEEVEALPRLLMPTRGAHTAPHRVLLPDEPPAHPRFGPLLDTPADGIEAVRHDGTLTVGGTGGFAPLTQTPDRPPWDVETGSFPAVSDDAPPPLSGPELDAARGEAAAAGLRARPLRREFATGELRRIRDGLLRDEPPGQREQHEQYANGWQ